MAEIIFFVLKIILHIEDFLNGVIPMNAVESIVGIYKNRCGLRFDKDAAESLGLDGKTFSNYMKGRRRLPDIAIAKMADMAHIDAMQIIAAVNVTYEKTPEEERPFWLEKLKSASGQLL